MRLSRIEIEGFRGFAQAVSFDLNADTVIIVGSNGQGKTSLFDAILWALSGSIPRLGNDDAKIISLYSLSGMSRVRLELQSDAGNICVINRASDGKKQRLSFEIDGNIFADNEAKYHILKLLWPEAITSDDSEAALTTAITRSVYLQQDLVRQFIETDDEQAKFSTVSELVGSGRVTELQLELESARAAWTRATTNCEKEAKELLGTLTLLEGQLARLADVSPGDSLDVVNDWNSWWDVATGLGVKLSNPEAGSGEAPMAIDGAIKQLRELRRSNGRQHALCKEIIFEMNTMLPAVVQQNIEYLQKTYDLAEQNLSITRNQLQKAEQEASTARYSQVERRETREELIALAQLALRHLGETCPVCNQEHDIIKTRRRLEDLVKKPVEEIVITQDLVLKIAADLENQEKICIDAKAKLNEAVKKEREYRNWINARDSRLKELGIKFEQEADVINNLTALDVNLENQNGKMADLEERGERLALKLAQVAELARRSELIKEVVKAREELQNQENVILDRHKTGELVTKIIEGLRDSAYFVVEEQLKHIEPVLRGIYAMIDPHPVFRDVRFVTRFVRGRGRLNTQIDDRHADLTSESPWAVLSSSQMNALAVAVFLSFNLGMTNLPIETALLDDPLQSLDDVNLLGLIDLLRRTKDRRQLIISTHDSRFSHLLQRKLRPIKEHHRTVVIKFGGWSRTGPDFTTEAVAPDLEPMRIAVS